MEGLNLHFSKIVPLKILADKVKLAPIILVIGMLVIAFLLSFSSLVGNIVVLITGMIYPALMSFSAIYLKDADENKQWLTYWVLFAGCNFVDYFFNTIFFAIPFFNTIKLCFLIYLFFPTSRGSSYIYENLIGPKLLNNDREKSTYSKDSTRHSAKED